MLQLALQQAHVYRMATQVGHMWGLGGEGVALKWSAS
jgi:hypothetical protein